MWELGVHLSASLRVTDLGHGGRLTRELARELEVSFNNLTRELEVSLEEGREIIKRKVHEVLVLVLGSAAEAVVREEGVVVRKRALAEAHLMREAIRSNQTQSDAVEAEPWPKAHLMREAIRSNQTQSDAVEAESSPPCERAVTQFQRVEGSRLCHRPYR